jgi:hypothetical protein
LSLLIRYKTSNQNIISIEPFWLDTKHPIRTSHPLDWAFWLDKKHPIRTSYPLGWAFWLDIKHPIRTSYQLDWAFWFSKKKHPIRTSYPLDWAFWLDNFGVQVRNSLLEIESFMSYFFLRDHLSRMTIFWWQRRWTLKASFTVDKLLHCIPSSM